MWVNYLFDFCTWFITSIEFIGGILGIVLFYWCFRGYIKVNFYDSEDDDDE